MIGQRLRLSIAMATYNGAQFISEQLESFIKQTRLPDELVITDDASTDRTVELVEEFARSAPFPVHLHQNPQKLGITRNFEKALSLCTGDIIFLSDQDDVWFPDKLATVEKGFLENPSAQVVVNNAVLADGQLQDEGQTQFGNIRRAGGSDHMFIAGCCSAHRASWHELVLPIPEETPHDLWINGAAIELGCHHLLPMPMQVFRRHGQNSSDWILSDPAGVSFWRAIGHEGLTDSRQGWREQAKLLTNLLERLRERPGIAEQSGWQREIPRIERKITGLQKRISICTIPRHRRPFRVLGFWMSGGYETARGWKSALKDVVRP